MPNKNKRETRPNNSKKEITSIDKQIGELLKKLETIRGTRCLLFLGDITSSIVKDVYQDLRKNYSECGGKLDVFVDSGGGDIDAAYNIATLLQEVASEKLTFIIPRWAKSAATLLASGGDEILMTQIAELGPLDPQISEINLMEGRYEQFSPLHIENTLSLIRKEFEKGSKELAAKLIDRLQFPLTLGSFLKSLEVGEKYVKQLLKARMFQSLETETAEAKSDEIAKRLSKEYADHGYCVKATEAKQMGLNVNLVSSSELDLVMDIYELYDKKRKIKTQAEQEEILEKLKNIPPELLPKEMLDKSKIAR